MVGKYVKLKESYYSVIEALQHSGWSHSCNINIKWIDVRNSEKMIEQLYGTYQGRVSFHNSCHSYREIGIKEIPEKIFNQISGMEYIPAPGEPVCCGFGGLFSFKYDTISASMANVRLKTFVDLQVNTLVVNDPGLFVRILLQSPW